MFNVCVSIVHGRADDEGFEIPNRREAPNFFVIDNDLRVIFESATVPLGDAAVQAPLDSIIRALKQRLADGAEPTAFAIVSPTRVVRLMKLEVPRGEPHFAVFLERFAARNSIAKAATRFGLSKREVDVLDGLMRGHSTKAIALRLEIGTTTVQEHIRKIGRKTNVTKRSEIVAAVFGLANE